MKRYHFFLIFLISGCLQQNIKIDQHKELKTIFLALKNQSGVQGIQSELSSFVELGLKKVLTAKGYSVVFNKKSALYQLSLDFICSEHKNPFLNENGFSIGEPFFHQIIITLNKNNEVLLNRYPLVNLDFLTYPVDVQFRDWYNDVQVKKMGQNIVERIELVIEAWIENA